MLEHITPCTFFANPPPRFGVVLERDVGFIGFWVETMAYLEFDRTYPFYAKVLLSVANVRGRIFLPRALQSQFGSKS